MNANTVPTEVKEHPPSAKQLGVAVIGCGYWGMNYVRIFNELTESRVVAVWDQRPDRLKKAARRFPGVYRTTQVDDGASPPGAASRAMCPRAPTRSDVQRQRVL